MNEIRVSVWNVLRPVLAVGMVVMSALACDTGSGGGSSKKSSDAEITELQAENLVIGDRWAAFSLKDTGATEEGTQYYLGVKPANDPVPTESAMTMAKDLNVKTYILGTTAINVILASKLGSPLISFFSGKWNAGGTEKETASRAMWTDTDVGFTNANIMTGDDEYSARNSMLTPETEYKIYIRKDGESTVSLLHSFTTAATDITTETSDLELLPAVATLYGNTITMHKENWEIVPLQLTAPLNPATAVLVEIVDPDGKTVALEHGAGMNVDLYPRAYPEFFYFAGDASDYSSSDRLLSLRGIFGINQGADQFIVRRQFYPDLSQVLHAPTIIYQENP